MIIYLLSFFLSLGANKTTLPTVLHFEHLANGKKLERNKIFQVSDQRNSSIKQWKYHISHLEFLTKKGESVKVAGIFLIDAFGNDSIPLALPKGNYTGIKYAIGIDSSIHLSGAQDGALDPLNGMYWAWNTGYIHFKLEGEEHDAVSTNQRFQYHIGGFSGTNKTMQLIEIPFSKKIKFDKEHIALPIVEVDVVRFLNSEVVKMANPLIMKEGRDAVAISKIFPLIFSVKN